MTFTTPVTSPACELCAQDGGKVIAHTSLLRVVHVDDAATSAYPSAAFPGFFRVIWNTHVAEFTDLSEAERAHCMGVVCLVERALRRHLQPDKINLATLGNVTPHLHWHVIARFKDDTHFPQPIWAAAQRPAVAASLERIRGQLPQVITDIIAGLSAYPRP